MPLPITLSIPEFSLVLLVGPHGAGKSTFAQCHFADATLSLDHDPRVIGDPAATATEDAFQAMLATAELRLTHRQLTVIDAPNLAAEPRRMLATVAKRHYANTIAIAFDASLESCLHHNRQTSAAKPAGVIRGQVHQLEQMLKAKQWEGIAAVHTLTEADVGTAQVERTTLRTDRRIERGPFDILGDTHACSDELHELVGRLGYQVTSSEGDDRRHYHVSHPEGRRLIGLGDYGDRGPDNLGSLAFWMDATACGAAITIYGNHDRKLLNYLRGKRPSGSHGFDRMRADMDGAGPAFRAEVAAWLGKLTSHLWLDDGKLAVAHAGIKADMIGRSGRLTAQMSTYGDTTGTSDEFGLPVRLDWAAAYQGDVTVVYGHVPSAQAVWRNNTLCIDTACCFGGALTALRWPECRLMSVPARRAYAPLLRA